MRATQVKIAEEAGIDVSSVNKILNRDPRSVFKKETVAKVFEIARDLGYPLKRETKRTLRVQIEILEDALTDLWAEAVGSQTLPTGRLVNIAAIVTRINKAKRKVPA